MQPQLSTYIPNPGRRSYPVVEEIVDPKKSYSNLRRAHSGEELDPVTNVGWAPDQWLQDEPARHPDYSPIHWQRIMDREPTVGPVDDIYVILNMVAGVKESASRGFNDEELEKFIVKDVKRKLNKERLLRFSKNRAEVYTYTDDAEADVIRCEEGDERRFCNTLQRQDMKVGDIVIGRNSYLKIISGSTTESTAGRYRNCRVRVGFMIYRNRKWCRVWNTVVNTMFDHEGFLYQPQVHPPHMAIALRFTTPPVLWVKRLAKAVIIFEDYIDQVHAYLSSNVSTSSSTKESYGRTMAAIARKSYPPKVKRGSHDMERYWIENMDMSNRWNRIFSRMSRHECLEFIDAQESIWDIVQAMNPRKREGLMGVVPEYKFDFTGLISLGGYGLREPLMTDIHGCFIVRQCFFTYRHVDQRWIQRIRKFVNRAIMQPEENFMFWADTDNVDHKVLELFGMMIHEKEFRIIHAHDRIPDGWPYIDGNLPGVPPASPHLSANPMEPFSQIISTMEIPIRLGITRREPNGEGPSRQTNDETKDPENPGEAKGRRSLDMVDGVSECGGKPTLPSALPELPVTLRGGTMVQGNQSRVRRKLMHGKEIIFGSAARVFRGRGIKI